MHISSLFLIFDANLCFFYTQNAHFTEKNTIFVHEKWQNTKAAHKGTIIDVDFIVKDYVRARKSDKSVHFNR